MQLIALVIIACDLGGRPCQEYQLNYADMTLFTCTVVSPRLIAQFMESHPQRYPRKWRCEVPGLKAKA